MQSNNSAALSEQIKLMQPLFQNLKNEIHKTIIGQEETINLLCIGILSNGHILLEGMPGVAKTTLIKTTAESLGLSFSRIQFTPDLLPSDIIGTLIYNPKTMEFETKKGPLFANFILADEINRSPAKVQSALLEAMQEHQITIGSNSFKLDAPFLVFATQNPIENEGTYQLPEAQVDRFMFKILINYPTLNQEREILKRSNLHHITQPVVTKHDLFKAKELINQIYIDDRLIEYILAIIFATRNPKNANLKELAPLIACGASPRASLAILHASKSFAFLQGRHFVVPDDIKAIITPILRHRIILTYQAMGQEIKTDEIIKQILNSIMIP